MDDTRRREIEERLAKITPEGCRVDVVQYFLGGGNRWDVTCGDVRLALCFDKTNAALIANMPADLRYLLDRLAAVEAERDAALVLVEKLKPSAMLEAWRAGRFTYVDLPAPDDEAEDANEFNDYNPDGDDGKSEWDDDFTEMSE